MKRRNKNRENKLALLYKIISVVLVIMSVIFVGIIFYIDLLPFKYSFAIFAAVLVFDTLNIFLIRIKRLKSKVKKTLSIFMSIAILVMLLGCFYLARTIGVLLGNGDSKYKLENYSVIVLKESPHNKLSDIEDETVGYFENSIGAKKANEILLDKINVDFKSYSSSNELIDDLLNKKIDVIVLENSIIEIIKEDNSSFNDLVKVIYSFEVKTKVESTLKDADVTEETFIVYISGIDTYGEISSVSRSDVNMVMIVNPKIHQILLISIPRDYYVQLHGTTGVKDKLTHAGIYGIDMSIQTIEDLLEIDINYYLKVNFTSVIDIVDALGGVDVYSEYTFVSYSGYNFTKGMNSVNGEQALDFARTRKAFSNGDRQRGINQQALIEALIRKASNKSIITKYNSLLSSIDGKYQTNMSMKKITALVKVQLDKMPNWTISSYSLTGSDSMNYTYTSNQLLYVMEPDEESVQEAITLINKILNDGELDNSYDQVGGNSNKVTKSNNNVASNNTSKNQSKQEETPVQETQSKKTEQSIKKEETYEEPDDALDEILPEEQEQQEEEDLDSKDDFLTEDDAIDSIVPEPESEDE